MTRSTASRDSAKLIHSLELGAIISAAVLALVILEGCGGGSVGLRGPALPSMQRDLEHDPVVVFIGDEVTANWQLPNPLWINKGVADQTSAQVLARFQTDVIDLHPDVVHILVGTWEIYSLPSPPTDIIMDNITAMVQMAQAAGIRVIVAMPPPESYTPSTQADPTPDADVDLYILDEWIAGQLDDPPPLTNVTVVDYADALAGNDMQAFYLGGQYATGLTTNLIDPNAAGYAVMDPLVEAAIASLKVGGQK